MINSSQLTSISDLKTRPGQILDQINASSHPIGIVRRNRLEAYLINAQVFEQLQAMVEDLEDDKLTSERLDQARPTDFLKYAP